MLVCWRRSKNSAMSTRVILMLCARKIACCPIFSRRSGRMICPNGPRAPNREMPRPRALVWLAWLWP